MLVILHVANAFLCAGAELIPPAAGPFADAEAGHDVTNVSQFRTLSASDYCDGCDFHLTGVVTLVDTNRDLVVLQDETGAMALNFPLKDSGLRFGQRVSLAGTNCCPYFPRFPSYPYHPTVREIRSSFEAPTGCGDYYLTRMRGYLHPTVTGEYSFWIASDNSSELWLSVDRSASKARKIAFIARFGWVAPREWSRFPSQRSEPVRLQAGKSYYIEALHEQTTVGDHLAVAWQGPGLEQSVIDGRYLTPPGREPAALTTNGVLREFYTNYTAGDLAGVGGARPFQSVLSVENVGVRLLGQGQLPRPDHLVAGQPWHAEDDFRWVSTEGQARFIYAKGNAVWFELAGDLAQVEVCAPRLDPALLRRMHAGRVRVEGVCEGLYDQNESLVPGRIWVSGEDSIRCMENVRTNAGAVAVEHAASTSVTKTDSAMQGFYSTRGVVTFNDRVLGQDYLIVQEGQAAVLVAGGETRAFQRQLQVGEWVEMGGALQPGKPLPVLSPLVITELGLHSLPAPTTAPLGIPVPADQGGKWTELEGVVHSANSNGMVSVMGKDRLVCFWIGGTSSNDLPGYVDAKLRARGVLLLNARDVPLLLVPSRQFVEVEESAPADPFATARRSISEFGTEAVESSWPHRVQVAGEVTYRDAQSFFLQDATGAIRVQITDPPAAEVGQTVEVLGFPAISGATPILTEAVLRPGWPPLHIQPRELDLGEAVSSERNGTLVLVNGTLLARRTNGVNQVLELQEQHRVFSAILPAGHGGLPDIVPGSRLQVVGVSDHETVASPLAGEKSGRLQYLASLNIRLRSPNDVTILSGPPWWTWERAVSLVGTLLAVIMGTLLWVRLLHRRLGRQQARQLAFARQVLARLEDERRRIAVNLHDSLGQTLLVIKNHALLAMQRPPDEQGLRQRLDQISDATSQAIEEVRQITHGLRPYQLDRLGLTQAIRASIARASADCSISFATRVEDIDGLFDKDSEIHVYRIVQEAVTNVIKHSGATEAAVVIKKRTPVVSLSIRDNGRGFDTAEPSFAPRELGSGLSGIAERVRILGGTLAIDGHPAGGTSLTVEVPLANCRHETRNIRVDR